ncbi:PIN domain-containing protein [Microbacterium nanhaiense]|uniref:PIN domain-containing protein n=1 Tax=Microbacterium nanhaiense TaxID=1301026 RepID=UPI00166B73D0|nr:PIN domain-containing protein [Microbacterium nanhaiense]
MQKIFVDANVLGSKTQYDWLFMLRLRLEMFTLWTSNDVLDEAHRVWRRRKPDLGGAMRAQRDALFRRLFDDVSDAWNGGASDTINDVHDVHVHNAARSLGADILLTNNGKDFGDPNTLPYDIYSPDEFFVLVNANAPQAVRDVARDQALYWHRRSGDTKYSLAKALAEAGCPSFAREVERHLVVLSGSSASLPL